MTIPERRNGGVSPAGPYRAAAPLLAFLWPFLYLHAFVVPVDGTVRAIRNDFIELYFNYKAYLLDCLATFRFPLWSPAEAAGYPFYSNPFAQAFYPLNLLLVPYYRVAGGYTAYSHQLFTLAGISIFASGLYAWLKRVGGNPRAALFATLVMSASFKVTEILRFPNAVHTAAWYPWVLYAMTRVLSPRSLPDLLAGGGLLCVFLVCLCTGGYPYYLYYSLFLFGPYLIPFLAAPLRERLLGFREVEWKRSLPVLAAATLAAGAICSPYLLAILRLMGKTADRAGGSFEYSTTHPFTFRDTLGSLVYPPAAQAEGWYFFGIGALLVLLFYFLLSRPGSTSPSPGSLSCKLFFLAWIGTVSYITYGRESYLFRALWGHLPGFTQLRVWGRMNIVLVPVLAWLLSFSYAFLEETVSRTAPENRDRRMGRVRPLLALALAYAAVIALQLHFFGNDIVDPYWTAYFRHLDPAKTRFLLFGFSSFAALALILAVSWRGSLDTEGRRWSLFVLLVLLASIETAPVGTRTWVAGNMLLPPPGKIDVERANAESFSRRRIDRYGTIPLRAGFSVGIVENWYFQRYVSFRKRTEGETEARDVLLGVSKTGKIFFSRSIEHPTVEKFLDDALRFPETGRLLSYDGDRLAWEIDAPAEGHLSFIDNWDDGWIASVDGRPAGIDRLFGTFKSVRLSPGLHTVVFDYRPGIF